MSSEFVEEYNSLLSGEISAVETYDLAIKHCTHEKVLAVLNQCRTSHAERVYKLTQRVTSLGGNPAEGSGVWGPFAECAQDSAKTEHDALGTLEESEAERLASYESNLKILVGEVLHMVDSDLLPPQKETHTLMKRLYAELTPVETA